MKRHNYTKVQGGKISIEIADRQLSGSHAFQQCPTNNAMTQSDLHHINYHSGHAKETPETELGRSYQKSNVMKVFGGVASDLMRSDEIKLTQVVEGIKPY